MKGMSGFRETAPWAVERKTGVDGSGLSISAHRKEVFLMSLYLKVALIFVGTIELRLRWKYHR